MALSDRPQAWRPPGIWLELRPRLSPRQVREPLAAQALRLQHPRHRPPPAAPRLQPRDRARHLRGRAPLVQANLDRRASGHSQPRSRRSTRWGQAVNCLVLSRTAPHVPSGTESSCYRGQESAEKASVSKRCKPRNFSNKESFGFLLTEPAKTRPCGATASGLNRRLNRRDPSIFAGTANASERDAIGGPARTDRGEVTLEQPLLHEKSLPPLKAKKVTERGARA